MLLGRHFHRWRQHLSDPVLLRFYLIGTMLTNVFITVFNYSTFRLAGAPYHLGPRAISVIFLSYALGIVSSSSGRKMVDRFGRWMVLDPWRMGCGCRADFGLRYDRPAVPLTFDSHKQAGHA